MRTYDVIVIGGGPAGLAAAVRVAKSRQSVLVIERESRAGGILKQCIHDGFGLVRFKEKLSGPEYTERFLEEALQVGVEISVNSFVSGIKKRDSLFELVYVCPEGLNLVKSRSVILATGARERSARQVFIQGTRPSGIFTAGTAQYYVNILGKLPTKRCVILGSGDIGLIMARRLTLEGASVEGVYEIKNTPSGLSRNIQQCLKDFDIPLYLSHTVTRVFGEGRLTGVEVQEVDENMKPIAGTERIIPCDALILSVGLIPENEVAESIYVPISPKTKGAIVDQNMMTLIPGVFACGNCLHINDLVDYVSESAEVAADGAVGYFDGKERTFAEVQGGKNISYCVPQRLDVNSLKEKTVCYFRVDKPLSKSTLVVKVGEKELYRRSYLALRPPEMQRIEVDFSSLSEGDNVVFDVE